MSGSTPCCNRPLQRIADNSKSEGNFLEKGNVLVTGGAGFIGSHLVDELIAQGYRVRVLDALVPQVHGENAAPINLNSAAEFISGDVCDREAIEKALDGIDVVFN
jgi:dTDP-L-rhamnose 4-epimerase